ncbi:MAG TPA: hypothetical protein VG102_02585 [Candidatus Paceibacterota bacterium]|jgi:hypothetical protein|nr:hypothetical protein [Candidatus Paceibacterota bacterium]
MRSSSSSGTARTASRDQIQAFILETCEVYGVSRAEFNAFGSSNSNAKAAQDYVIHELRDRFVTQVRAIDILLQCAPNRVREALGRPKPTPPKGSPLGLETWQFPDLPVTPRPVIKHSPAKPAGKPVMPVPPKAKVDASVLVQRRTTLPTQKPLTTTGRTVEPPLPAKPNAAAIERVLAVVSRAISISRRELASEDGHLRLEAGRDAVALVMEFLNVHPRHAAPFIGCDPKIAAAKLNEAHINLVDRRKATYVFTVQLCKYLAIDPKQITGSPATAAAPSGLGPPGADILYHFSSRSRQTELMQ